MLLERGIVPDQIGSGGVGGDYPNLRSRARTTTVFRLAKLITSSEELCAVRNISAGGVSCEVFRGRIVGERVSIDLGDEVHRGARVVWTEANLIGLSFDKEIDVAATLSKMPRPRRRSARPLRVAVSAGTVLTHDGKQSAGRLIDISQGGAKLASDIAARRGDELVLDIHGLPSLHGHVVWRRDGQIGVAFAGQIRFHRLAEWIASAQPHSEVSVPISDTVAFDHLDLADARHLLTAEGASDVLWEHDLESGIVSCNQAFTARFGFHLAAVQNSDDWWLGQIHEADREAVMAYARAALQSRASEWICGFRLRRVDGSFADTVARGSIIRGQGGAPIKLVGTLVDVSEARSAARALQLGEERLRLATTAAGLGIADYDLVTGEVHWSPQLRSMLGLGPDVPAGWESVRDLLAVGDQDGAHRKHLDALDGKLKDSSSGLYRITRASDGVVRWMRANATTLMDELGKPIRLMITVRDITDQKEAEDRLIWLANHDFTTGLLNRRAFQTELEAEIERARGSSRPLVMLLIDLDDFKFINDTLGHQAGDDALAELAVRLNRAAPANAAVARLGGDEFAMLLPDADLSQASALCEMIFELLRRPFEARGRLKELRASIGVSCYPLDGRSASKLIKAADMALYAAKEAGRGTFRCFEPALRAKVQRQVSMLSQARTALERNWIRPYFQPKVALASGELVGFEALLRWRHPSAGWQAPDSIGAAFDDSKLALQIGEEMARQVVAQLRRWTEQKLPFGRVAINASAAEFRVPGYADRLLNILTANNVAAPLLEIEITETTLINANAELVLSELKQLRAAGITIALDDFGTGYSSLSHLRIFPVDAIKIDRSFTANLATSPDDRGIVSAMARLAESLSLEVVAEGIETTDQAEFLRSIGCALGQGYLYGKAVAAKQVPATVRRTSPT